MKKLIIIYLCFLLPLTAFSQDKEISGKVVDETNMPLPGASIIVTDTNIGTQTNFDGVFKFKIPEKAKSITISYLGYKDKVVQITSSINYIVQLEVNTSNLDEVVVVGYGNQRRSDITGAVTKVEITQASVAQNITIDQLLQGRAAGVQVTQNGTPGGGVTVRIRGANSLRGNNEPLYVIDGVIISSAGEDAITSSGSNNDSQEPQNGLNGINPRDIESIEILKDASATAIYGSRGANGVVLITTKQGKQGKTRINTFYNSSVSMINERIDVLNGLDFANYRNESASLNGGSPIYSIDANNNIFPIVNGVVSDTPLEQVNWHDEVFKQGFSTSAGANFSGGTEKGTYFISYNFNNFDGLVKNAGIKTGTFNINLKQNLSDKLELKTRLSAFYGKGQSAQDGNRVGGPNSFISNVLAFSPLVENNSLLDNDFETSSPLTWVNDFDDVSDEERYIANVDLTYNLGKGFKIKFQAGGNIRNKTRDRFFGLTTFQGSTQNGFLQLNELNSKAYQINNLLQYNRTFNRKHRINAVAGITYDYRSTINTNAEFSNFSTVEFRYRDPSFAQNIVQPLRRFRAESELLSFLGRGTYTYDDKYVLTGTLRVDGSSKFAEGNKYGYFPSFAFAWRAINEKFLEDNEFFTDLKLRAGWGQVGNQGIQPYQTLTNYTTSNYGDGIGFVPSNIGNRDLTWETTEQTNVGLDFSLLKNRLTGTLDAYVKKTRDLLQTQQIPTSTGFSSILVNRGDIENKGIELSLSGVLVDNEKDFSIEIGGNIAFNRSKITDLDNQNQISFFQNGVEQTRPGYFGDQVSSGGFFASPANIFVVGEEIGMFIGWETNGIWQTGDTDIPAGFVPGDVRIVDQNNDGIIDSNDRTIIGNPNPNFIYGITLNVNYKRVSLQVLMNGVHGNDIANGNSITLNNAIGLDRNITPEAYFNAWRPDNPSNVYPRINYGRVQQAPAIEDRIIEDGSFLRINNITLGYDIPMENSKIFSRVNVFLSGINLFTFTNYSGYNPEVTSFLWNGNILGVDWNGVQNMSSIMFGLNLDF